MMWRNATIVLSAPLAAFYFMLQAPENTARRKSVRNYALDKPTLKA